MKFKESAGQFSLNRRPVYVPKTYVLSPLNTYQNFDCVLQTSEASFQKFSLVSSTRAFE